MAEEEKRRRKHEFCVYFSYISFLMRENLFWSKSDYHCYFYYQRYTRTIYFVANRLRKRLMFCSNYLFISYMLHLYLCAIRKFTISLAIFTVSFGWTSLTLYFCATRNIVKLKRIYICKKKKRL